MEIILYVKTTWNCQTDEYLKQYDKRQTWSAIDVEHSRGALKKKTIKNCLLWAWVSIQKYDIYHQ